MERLARSLPLALAAALLLSGCASSGPEPLPNASARIAGALAAVPADAFADLGLSVWIGPAPSIRSTNSPSVISSRYPTFGSPANAR